MTRPGPDNRDHILVVEDSQVQVALVCNLLEEHGYQAHSTTTIAGARARIRTAPPDLVLLDRDLPDGDGSVLCRELKGDPSTGDIPIILLTAKGRLEDRVQGLLGGADDYIPKPYHEEELLARVQSCLRTRGLQKELRKKAEELEQKNRDLLETQARLVQVQRLAAIGQIGLAIRHEINNPLSTIMGHAELLLDQREDLTPDLQKKLKAIQRGCARIRDVVKRLEELRDDRTVEYIPGMDMIDLQGKGGEPGEGGDS
jgi:DNA-binding response OmpR family regulator